MLIVYKWIFSHIECLVPYVLLMTHLDRKVRTKRVMFGQPTGSLASMVSHGVLFAADIHGTFVVTVQDLGFDEVNGKNSIWLVVLRLNVPVNNFSVMSGRSHRFLGN